MLYDPFFIIQNNLVDSYGALDEGGGSPCRMSSIRNGNVALSNLRKGCMVVSNLRKGVVHVAKA